MSRYSKFKQECRDWAKPLLVISFFVVPIAFPVTNWALRPRPDKPLDPTDKELEIAESKRLEEKAQKEKIMAWHRNNTEEFEKERVKLFAYCHQKEMRFCNDIIDKEGIYDSYNRSYD